MFERVIHTITDAIDGLLDRCKNALKAVISLLNVSVDWAVEYCHCQPIIPCTNDILQFSNNKARHCRKTGSGLFYFTV